MKIEFLGCENKKLSTHKLAILKYLKMKNPIYKYLQTSKQTELGKLEVKGLKI